MEKVLTVVIGLLLIFAVATAISLFFIKFGWSLFMVPVFNMAELTWGQALGLSFLAGAFRSYQTSNEK